MDIKTFLTAFGLLFMAEIGDKTQLAALTLSASSNQRLSVFLGAASALVVLTGLAVLFGEGISRILPAGSLNRVAAVAFIVIGAAMLLKGS